MDTPLFLQACLIGLSIAAPVGPIGLLCIQRTLQHGARTGFASGLGAATADACYGAIGALGITSLTLAFTVLTLPLTLVGGAMLIWMGIAMLRSTPPAAAAEVKQGSHVSAFASVFALTLTNPMTILSFAAVFAVLGQGQTSSISQAALMVAGIFTGSALWWLGLACGIAAGRHHLRPPQLRYLGQTAGLLLIGFACWQLLGLVA